MPEGKMFERSQVATPAVEENTVDFGNGFQIRFESEAEARERLQKLEEDTRQEVLNFIKSAVQKTPDIGFLEMWTALTDELDWRKRVMGDAIREMQRKALNLPSYNTQTMASEVLSILERETS